MERDFDYENNNIAYDCQYTEEDGGGIKCKNYESFIFYMLNFDLKNRSFSIGKTIVF